MLKQSNISVLKAGIGRISKSDVISAKANLEINPLDAVILGFNVHVEEDISTDSKVKILTDDVIYKLIENLIKFREEKRKEIEKERLLGLSVIGKIRLLKQYVFKNTNPAIFGVRVEAGKISPGLRMIDAAGEEIGKIKNMELEKKSVTEAHKGTELAISMPGVNYERKMKNIEFLYTDIGESQFRNFKKNKDLLSASELRILQEIAEIKRKTRVEWGS